MIIKGALVVDYINVKAIIVASNYVANAVTKIRWAFRLII